MKPNKKVRLYVNGERQKDVYLHKTKWQIFKVKTKNFLKRLFWTILILAIAWGIYEAGSIKDPKVVEVEVKVEEKAPVLERIAKCESPTGHFKNGQVALYGNKDTSVDIGKYMINSRIWSAKATSMGLNLMVEKDNETFAKYLYQNYGTEPWKWSKGCWNK